MDVRDDLTEMVANIADIRLFRKLALDLFDGLIDKGSSEMEAYDKAIKLVYFLNAQNERGIE